MRQGTTSVAGATTFAGTTYVHEVLVALFLIFFPLNSTVAPAFVGPTKQVTAGLAAITLLHAALFHPRSPAGSASRRAGPRFPRPAAWVVLVLFVAAVTLATLASGKFASQWGDFATLPLSVAALAVCERFRAGSFAQLVAVATAGHLVIAVVANHRSIDQTTGVARLDGWNHPIMLGMEAGLLAVACVIGLLQRRRHRLWLVLLTALAGWVMWQAYSKGAFLAAVVALVVALATYRKAYRGARTALLLSWGTLGALLAARPIAEALVGGQVEVWETGTGRTQIWSTILAAWPEYIVTGYGWAPLHAGVGPEARLFELTGHLGAENSFLAALTMAGLLGFLLYAAVWVAIGRQLPGLAAPTQTYVVALGAFLLVAAQSIDSLAGLNFLWWWLLALFSVANLGDTRDGKNRYAWGQRVTTQSTSVGAA